jgi:hypothetical protein
MQSFTKIFVLLNVSLITAAWRPESPIQYSTSASIDSVAFMIKTQRKFYSEADLSKIVKSANASNKILEKQITFINNEISNLIDQRQRLVHLNDINEIQNELEIKIKNRDEIKSSFEQDLSNAGRKALYLIVLDSIDPLKSKEELSSLSEAALTPKAINDLRGVFVESFTKTVNNMTVADLVKGTISGAMTVDSRFLAEKRNATRRFIYLAKITVSPLKRAESSKKILAEERSRATIVDLTAPEMSVEKCKELKLTEEDCGNIFEGIVPIRTEIMAANDVSKINERRLFENFSKLLKEINIEISNVELEIQSRESQVITVIQGLLGVACKGPTDSCLIKALSNIDKKIADKEQQKLNTKANEIFTQRSRVTPEGDPARDISVTANGMVEQLNSTYGKVEQFFEETQIESNMLKAYELIGKKNVLRTADSVWLYIVPNEDGSFEELLCTKFIIKMSVSNNPIDKVDGFLQAGDTLGYIKTIIEAANNNDPKSQVKLAIAYFYGLGVKQDYNEAAKWYKEAAIQGSPIAQYNLGLIYYKGDGVPLNYSTAIQWYIRAADQGYSLAQYNLGLMYEFGIGTQKNDFVAKDWYRRAAQNGSIEAKNKLVNFGQR